MPVLAGWLTGEQVPLETIEEALAAMGEVLGRHGGQLARSVLPGAGIIAFSDDGHAMQHNDDPPVLDWVPDRRTLVYRRPLSGAHVLYYVEDWPAQGNLLFASEIKALLAVGVPRRLHIAALDALLRYGFIPAPWTAFKDIRIVPAGSILRWQKAKTVVNTSTDYHIDEPISSGNIPEQLHTLLNAAIAGMLPPHEQFVALTPGDTLSALPALLTAQHAPAQFPIVALDYTNNASQIWKSTERVAAACQRPFLEVMGVDEPEFWVATLLGLEAPSIDSKSVMLHQLLHTVASETEARVAISGSGAHILAGTAVPTQPLATNSELAGMLSWYRNTLLEEPGKQATHIWSRDVAELLQKEERWEETLHARKLARRAEQFADRQQGWYYLDLHLRLPDRAVHPIQQMAMQERLVVRSPYLNAHVMDMLTRLPLNLADGTSKEQFLAQLARRSMPARTKLGTVSPLIVPMNSLLDIEGSDLLQQTLSPEALRASGIFDPGVVEELLKMQEKGKRELLLVFTTQLFWRLFEMEV